jgi:NADH dehydrogenase
MKTLDDALSIRQRLFTAFEIAETLPPGAERDSWLTFAVAGGGPTGVELAGQIREMATRTLANEFHSIEPEEARVLLFDGGDRVLKTFDRNLAGKAEATLQKLGVELHLGVRVTDVDRGGVTVTPKSGGPQECHQARTVLWTAGVEAVPFARRLAEKLGVTTDRAGRLQVEPDLSVAGHPEIFVIGDLVGRDDLPGVAENAMQGGLHVASCIRRELMGRPRRKYRYRDLGSAAYISRGNALLQVGPLKVAGFTGWVAWGLLHIAFLTGVRNRVSTVVTWLATISRASRYHRAFMLGSADAQEERYTWSSEDQPAQEPSGNGAEPAGVEARGSGHRSAMTISSDDVRRLLQADESSSLVLIEGRTEVITSEQKSSDAYLGAFDVISRGELLERTGGETQLADSELAAQAAALDAAVSELGG